MWTKTLFVGFVLCLLRDAKSNLITTPSNVAGVVGSRLTLACSTDITVVPFVLWLKVAPDGQTTRLTNNGVSSSPEYTVTGTETPGTFNLQINTLAMSEGGTYRCSDYNAAPIQNRDAEVIALASPPSCTTNVTDEIAVEGEYINMTCSINYNATSFLWAPVMRWSQGSNDINSDDESSPGTSQYSITIVMTPELNGQIFSCETYFNPPPTPSLPDFASNTPGYTSTWNYDLVVKYPPFNVQITPVSATYNPGDQVTCSAEGNPGATFQWKDLNTNETTNGNVLTIPGFIEGGNNDHRFVCIASNTFKGQEYSTQSSVLQFNVVTTTTTSTTTTTTTTRPPTTTTTPDPDATQLSGGAIAGIVIGCLLFLVLIGLLIIFLYRKGCLQSNKNKAANNTRPQNSRETAAKSPVGVDQVRHPQNNLDYPPKPGGGFPAGEEPPPYNTSPYGSMSREVPYHPDPMYDDPRARNAENLHYADLALDDTPRSRKPVQLYDNGTTDYAEIKRV